MKTFVATIFLIAGTILVGELLTLTVSPQTAVSIENTIIGKLQTMKDANRVSEKH